MRYTRRILFLLVIQIGCLTLAVSADDYPLRDAVEFRVREGLPNVFAKLGRGEAVQIAYLGGSITAQSGWRPKTLAWFQSEFPKAKISETNAAIGGTGSDLGVFRLQQDVLVDKPDLMFVEFAVNDGGASPERIHQAMEGIVRQTLRANPETDICFVYTLVAGWTGQLRDGKFPRAASAMEAVADYYGIPSIHMGLKVAQLEGEDKLIFTGKKPKTDEEKKALGDRILFSPDGVHPYTDSGHDIYLQAVVRSMNEIRKVGSPKPHAIPEPFIKNNWESAKIVPMAKATMSAGWKKLDPEKDNLAKRFRNRLPELYHTNKPGETITIRFKGTGLRIYDLLGPDCGQVKVTIDNHPPVTKPRFDKYCNYHRLASMTVAEGLPNVEHTIQMELDSKQPDKVALLAQRNLTMEDPKRYDDTGWYAGAILVVGDILGAK